MCKVFKKKTIIERIATKISYHLFIYFFTIYIPCFGSSIFEKVNIFSKNRSHKDLLNKICQRIFKKLKLYKNIWTIQILLFFGYVFQGWKIF